MLGSDYATAINEMTKPSDVSSAIAEVESAIELVVVASNIANVNWNSALTDVSLNIGETTTLMGNITGAVDGANAKVDITKAFYRELINNILAPADSNSDTNSVIVSSNEVTFTYYNSATQQNETKTEKYGLYQEDDGSDAGDTVSNAQSTCGVHLLQEVNWNWFTNTDDNYLFAISTSEVEKKFREFLLQALQ